MELFIQDGGFVVKTLMAREELEASFRLRHEIFCGELKWVEPSPDSMETDPYDPFSERIGVFSPSAGLIAHARVISSPNPFMIEREFRALLPEGYRVRKGPDVSEVTRLCVRRYEREGFRAGGVSHLLYKGIYQWSLGNGIRHLVMVVDRRYFRLLRLDGFPVESVNAFMTMPDGVRAAVITLDWRAFEERASRERPLFLEWISDAIEGRTPSRSLPHALY